MKVNVILDENKIISTDTLIDNFNDCGETKIYKNDNLLLVLKYNGKSEVVDKLLVEKNLSLEKLNEELFNFKKEVSLIAVTNDNQFIVSGDFNNYNPIYYCEKDKDIFVSFYPNLLGKITKQELNKTYFSLRIVNFDSVYPFSELTPWHNVKLLHSRQIMVSSNGEIKKIFPWKNSSGNKNIADITEELRKNVKNVLKKNLKYQTKVSADLSGGLDSTSLCYFCNDLGLDLSTIFLSPEDGADTDAFWSELASKEISSDHKILPYNQTVTLNNLDSKSLYKLLPFGPSESFRYLSLVQEIIKLNVAKGINLHINGHGGDELFGPLSTMAWSLFHSNYPKRWKNLYGFARLNKFNLFKFFITLIDNSSISDNLKQLEVQDFQQIDFDIKYSSRWIQPPFAPHFITQNAINLIVKSAKSYLEQEVEPYSLDKSVHKILEEIETHTLLQRDLNSMVPRNQNFRFISPFTDFSIVETSLKYNINERFNAKVTKPMLAAIRPNNMPIEFFKRRDKGEYSKSTFTEYTNRKTSLELIFSEDCVIYELGLVDKNKLLSSLNKFSADGELLENIMRIQVIELWLRGYLQSEGA